jgi:hypothetical protein
MAMVEQSIEHGADGGCIAKYFAPVVYWSI